MVSMNSNNEYNMWAGPLDSPTRGFSYFTVISQVENAIKGRREKSEKVVAETSKTEQYCRTMKFGSFDDA